MAGRTIKSKSSTVSKPTVRGLTVPQHEYSGWHLLSVLIIAGLLVSSGLALVRAAQAMRSLHSELDQLQTRQHGLMADYSRLLLSAAHAVYKPLKPSLLKNFGCGFRERLR